MYASSENLINDKDFAFLYDLNTSKNWEFWYYEKDSLDLDAISKDDAYVELRLFKNVIRILGMTLRLPDETDYSLYNYIRIDLVEAFCILLKRSAYLKRCSDITSWFGRPVPQQSMIVNQRVDKIYSEFGNLLKGLNQMWLPAGNLIMFADATHTKGAALNNTWGFNNSPVYPIFQPRIHQRIVYNGNKSQHTLKYKSITTANEIISNSYGPVEE